MSICIQNCVRCNWLWCFGNTAIQLAVDSPHKKPLNQCLDVFFVVSLSKLLKQQSICWCWKTSCFISYIIVFFIKIQSSPTNSIISKKLTTITTWSTFRYDRIIKFAGKIFQDVIISVFSKNVCTQICYNGRGGANSLVLISLGWFRCLPSFLRQGSSATHFVATQAMRSVLTLPGRQFHGPTRATSGGYFVLPRNEAIRDGIDYLPGGLIYCHRSIPPTCKYGRSSWVKNDLSLK